MITYNHEPYIKQAIESVLMQRCNFPIELVIGEDCSKDETNRICEEYAKDNPIINLLTSLSNLGMMPNLIRTLDACNGKYIAMLEGDDYWIDPLKLQKQVDFLEANEEYGLCCTDFNIFWQTKQKMDKAQFLTNPSGFPIFTNLEYFLESEGYMAPCTWVGRKSCFKITNLEINRIDATYAIMMDIFATTKVYVIPEVTAVYRYLDESASHAKSIIKTYFRYKGLLETQLEYVEKYNLPKELQNRMELRFYNRVIDLIVSSKDTHEHEKLTNLLKEEPQNLINILIYLTDSFHHKLLEFKHTPSYRLGHFILRPIKMFYHLFK
jgi:glucosyltransferase